MATRPDGWTFTQELRMLRSQMLIHSCLYYTLDRSIISDHEWQDRADKLTRLQSKAIEKYGHCNIGFYDEEFSDWDGSTGCHLSIRENWIVRKAQYILGLHHGRS